MHRNPLRNLPLAHHPALPGVPGCIHAAEGWLCGECFRHYRDDPEDYLEFGEHAAGIIRWNAWKAEIAAEVKLALCNADCLLEPRPFERSLTHA